jgi:hypothetical protein
MGTLAGSLLSAVIGWLASPAGAGRRAQSQDESQAKDLFGG